MSKTKQTKKRIAKVYKHYRENHRFYQNTQRPKKHLKNHMNWLTCSRRVCNQRNDKLFSFSFDGLCLNLFPFHFPFAHIFDCLIFLMFIFGSSYIFMIHTYISTEILFIFLRFYRQSNEILIDAFGWCQEKPIKLPEMKMKTRFWFSNMSYEQFDFCLQIKSREKNRNIKKLPHCITPFSQ